LTGILGSATNHLRSDLLRREIAQGKTPEALVLSDQHGKPWSPWQADRMVESAMERAGIKKAPGAVFNLLRHTFGSRMAQQGVDMTTLAAIMGNTPAVCYKHYIRFSPGHLRAAMATMDGQGCMAQSMARPPEGPHQGAANSVQVVET
jgi:site-specific recombinase XerD